MILERVFVRVQRGGAKAMTENERELINLIRESDNPQQALAKAMELMIDFLRSYGAPQDTSSVLHQEAS